MYSNLSEEDLLHRTCQGDALAFEQLYLRIRQNMMKFISARVRRHESAEDVVQEAFCRVWCRRAYRVGDASARTYLFGLAWCVMQEHRRAAHRAGAQDDIGVTMIAARPQPDKVEQAEMATLLQRARASLSANQLLAVSCVYDRGLTPRQAAEIARCSEKALRRRLEVARDCLRCALQDEKATGNAPVATRKVSS